MKKYIFPGVAALVVAIAIGAGFFLWKQLDTQSKVEEIVIKDDTTTIIGLDPTYAPMEFIDSKGEITGFDIDLINAAFSKMGESYKLRVMNWNDKTELLNKGEIDYIWSGLNVTEERKKIYELSSPYIKSSQIVIVPIVSDVYSQNDMANKRVGIPSGGFTLPKLKKFSKENPQGEITSITEFNSVPEALVAIQAGEIDVVVADAVVAGFYLKGTPGTYRVLDEVFLKTGGMAVAAKKGDREKIAKINKVLSQLSENGDIDKLKARWFSK